MRAIAVKFGWVFDELYLYILIKYINIGKFPLLYTYLSRRYGRKFTVFKEKVKGSDRDVSTVALLRVFLFQIFPFILLTSNSMVSHAILKKHELDREFFNDAKLHSSCGLVQFWSH